VTFTITGQQAEKLESIEGATFYVEGTQAAAVGNTGVPVNGDAAPGDGGTMQNGDTTTGNGSSNGQTQPAQDRIIAGVPDALLGAGLFAAGATVLVLTSSSGEG
jgi:hypothetical protein